jgi:hypothetical protein
LPLVQRKLGRISFDGRPKLRVFGGAVKLRIRQPIRFCIVKINRAALQLADFINAPDMVKVRMRE